MYMSSHFWQQNVDIPATPVQSPANPGKKHLDIFTHISVNNKARDLWSFAL